MSAITQPAAFLEECVKQRNWSSARIIGKLSAAFKKHFLASLLSYKDDLKIKVQTERRNPKYACNTEKRLTCKETCLTQVFRKLRIENKELKQPSLATSGKPEEK